MAPTSEVLTNINSRVLKKGDPAPGPVAPGTVRLYNMRFCPWAERVVFYLSLKGIKSEVINIHLSEKPEWFLEKNPQGLVPTLELDDGKLIFESALIPEFLDEKFPENSLLPADPHKRYQQRWLLTKFGPIAQSVYGLIMANNDEKLREEKFEAAVTAAKQLEDLFTGPFLGGDSIGFADVLLFPFLERHYILAYAKSSPFELDHFPGKKFPKLSQWYEKVSNIPEIKSTLIPPEAHLAFFKTRKEGAADYDIGL